ncbi:hypothetical protein [Xanthobacter sp. 126]|uniref:hypothetical protein n=1 Tax=Xanthobacter sp. 126 TaxID=1131814 RepID=UPI00045E817E|nr:hypothetical protein [Xanthobacter sp. 126]
MATKGELSSQALAVHVPRGPDAWWPAISKLDTIGSPWMVAEVVTLTGSDRRSIADYVGRLCAAGIAEAVRPNCYRLLRRPAETPRLERDGSVSPPTGQQQMWTAIRALQSFSYVELAHAASTDTQPISPVAAQAYVNLLGRAGYLAVLHKAKPGTPAVWRLKPSMNTGPLSPLVMRTKFVWDQNRRAVVGAAETSAEVRP